MHRHSYKGRKLRRDDAQRKALLRGLSVSLIEHGQIETTFIRAKELVPYFEKTITKAKIGNLHSRRQIVSKLGSIEASAKLIELLVPAFSNRTSGHLRIVKTKLRRGDNAQLAMVQFVDKIDGTAATTKPKAAVKAKSSLKPKAKVKTSGASNE